MNIFSYKQHLELITQKQKPKFVQKSLFAFLGVAFLALGFISSLFYYQYKKDEPLRRENNYLQSITGSFNTTKQGVDETLASFKVAGSKIKIIDSSKESTPQAVGFYTSLDDIDKGIDKIEALEKNIKFQKSLLKNQEVLPKFLVITSDITSFYNNSFGILETSKKEQQFAKDMLSATGLSFYLPVLSDEAMWASKDDAQIKKYYETKKLEANGALSSLAKLSVPPDFRIYYDNQIAYLTLFVETGSKITDILSKESDKNPEVATQLEKAYQVLNAAKKQNEEIASKLLSERLRVFDVKRNLERFASINLTASALNSRLIDLIQAQDQPKTDQVFQAFEAILARFEQTFLQGLQNDPII